MIISWIHTYQLNVATFGVTVAAVMLSRSKMLSLLCLLLMAGWLAGWLAAGWLAAGCLDCWTGCWLAAGCWLLAAGWLSGRLTS